MFGVITAIAAPCIAGALYVADIRTSHVEDMATLPERYVTVGQFKDYARSERKQNLRDLRKDIRGETDPELKAEWEQDLIEEIEDYCLDYPEDHRECGKPAGARP